MKDVQATGEQSSVLKREHQALQNMTCGSGSATLPFLIPAYSKGKRVQQMLYNLSTHITQRPLYKNFTSIVCTVSVWNGFRYLTCSVITCWLQNFFAFTP
jgi:hypothetical protein